MLTVILCCKKILENTHIKFPNFEFFQFECLTRIRMFEFHWNVSKFISSLQNKNVYKRLTLKFQLKAKENNKEAQNFKVN